MRKIDAMERDDLRDRAGEVNAGMLDTDRQRHVPMSHHAEPERDMLWFIAAQRTDVVAAVKAGPKAAGHVVSVGGKGIYASLRGTLTLSHDTAKLDEIWSVVADTGFEGGKSDPDVRLLPLDVKLTGTLPDSGKHFKLP